MANIQPKTITAKDTGDFEADYHEQQLKLVIDIKGFEGPLDLLLELARHQRIDLAEISVIELARQYLDFIRRAQKSNLIIAADYLVMAAWLTYLKSRLLVPDRAEEHEPDPDVLADALVLKLKRLAALKQAAEALFNRAQLGQERLCRGVSEGVELHLGITYYTTLHDILSAYGARKAFDARKKITFPRPPVVEIAEARTLLKRLLGDVADYVPLALLLEAIEIDANKRKSLFVSAFAALLELAKNGDAKLMQEAPMQPVYVQSARHKSAETSTTERAAS